jgi:hypothetical protein
MLIGCGWPRAAPSLLTLHVAYRRRVQRQCLTQRGLSTGRPWPYAVAAEVGGPRVKRSARTRSQRWSLAHSKEIRCDSKRESRLGWSTSIMKSPS